MAHPPTRDSLALQWLDPAQTADNGRPSVFTQGESALTRTWIPLQDSPGMRVRAPVASTVVLRDRADAEIRGAAIDCMIPVPSHVDAALVELGACTGRWMLEELKDAILARDPCGIVLTNCQDRKTKRDVAGDGLSRHACQPRFEPDTPVLLLPALLRKLLM